MEIGISHWGSKNVGDLRVTENRVWKIDTERSKAGQVEYCACVKLGWLQIGGSWNDWKMELGEDERR